MKIFSSHEGQDFNKDPEPYRVITGVKPGSPLVFLGEERSSTDWVSGDDEEPAFTQYEPRPEYNHVLNNPTNTILLEFRRWARDTELTPTQAAKEWVTGLNITEWAENVPPLLSVSDGLNMVIHAYKVLNRLTRLN